MSANVQACHLPRRCIVAHYSQLADRYDHRWRGYVRQTLAWALDALRLSGTERILDVGCGTGEFARMAIARFPTLTVVGLDATPAMLEQARAKLAGYPRVSFQTGDVDALPFVEGRFDAVVCANVFHHLRNPQQALQECVRVLRPGGQLVVVDWCRDFWHCRLMHVWLRMTDRTYVNMYRVAEVSVLLERLGVVVEERQRLVVRPWYGVLKVFARKPAQNQATS